MMKKRSKLNLKTAVLLILLMAAVCAAIFASVKLYGIYAAYKAGNKAYSDLSDKYVSLSDVDMPSAVEQPNIPSSALKAPIEVDFETLRKDCRDIIGWIYCPDTAINYPILQGRDNKYYVRRLPSGKWNINGSIFMDYRNSKELSDPNTIIYGHNIKNGSMFGCLKDYRDQNFFEAHSNMYILTPTGNYILEVFAGMTVEVDSIVYSLSEDKTARAEQINYLFENSAFSPNIKAEDIKENDKLVTLSTCAEETNTKRFVIVGLLSRIADQ